MKFYLILLLLFCSAVVYAQNGDKAALPYKQIPDYPANYRAGNVLSRFIDGLGYRYYWATEGLTKKDLDYKPSDEARTTMETIKHLYDLSKMIVNGATSSPNIRVEENKMTFEELRHATLLNFQKASQLFQDKKAKAISKNKVIFQRGDQKQEFPMWNLMNGPIADAIYHTGQVVSFRRASGNPMNPKVSVFIGKTGE